MKALYQCAKIAQIYNKTQDHYSIWVYCDFIQKFKCI